MLRSLRKLIKRNDGAVAPTIALALAGLVAVGGVAFDYARLAAMDTELQDAADQAALAAATQLDGQDGAVDRATSAAQQLLANDTRFANDGHDASIAVPTITFYSDYDPETGAKTGETTDDAEANYVEVTVETRTANYALTPIVAAFSGTTVASAFATLDSAYCNLPPFMMCAPANFNPDDHIGAGLHLVIGQPNTPGNFGFLQTGFGTGAENLAKAIGWNGSAGGCVAARGAITEPGDKQSVRAAVNTRFDMSESGQTCPAGGTCSPSTNSRKDLVHGTSCTSSGNQGWSETETPYRGHTDGTPLTQAQATNVPNMGHPPDMCHLASPNTCGIVGNGSWDRDAFFWVNYRWDHASWMANTGLPASATRYQVYEWEADHPTPDATHGIGHRQGPFQVANGNGKGSTTKFTDSEPVCRPPGVEPGNFDTDRRVASVAVVNCSGNDPNGRDTVTPVGWIDVFLVEPSFRRPGRTNGDEIYAEIIRTRPLPGVNQSIGNVVRRDVPRLIE
jgi:Flp pilus assembly protein TadG